MCSTPHWSVIVIITMFHALPVCLKGTQAWDNFEFFLTWIKSDVRTFPQWWGYTEPNFFDELSKKCFFFKIFTLVLLDGFLDGFWKFWLFIVKICILIWYFWVFFENYSMRMLIAEHTRKRFYRMLCIRGTDFIAHWAYEEQISAHAQPAVKCEQPLHVQSMMSIRGTNFIACWAYAEPISSHAEHVWKC